MWTLFLLHLVSFLWYQPAPCLQQLYPSFFSPALSHPLHYSSPPPPAPVPSVYPLRHYPPPLPSPPSSNLPMRYSRDQLLEIQPSTPNFELVNRLRELRLGVGLPRKRGCRGGRKKLRSIQVVPSRNLHPPMVPPFLQPHPDLQSAVGNAPLSSKHPTHLPTTDCLLSITPLMGGQPSDAPALSPPSPLQQGGQSSNAPALSPPSPLPQGSQPIALALSPSSPLPQDGQPSDAPGLSPSSSTLLLCPSDSTLSICHLNSQSAVKTVPLNTFIIHAGSALWTRTLYVPLLSGGDTNPNRTSLVHTTTTVACALECTTRQWCNSFRHTPHNSTCSLHSFVYVDGGEVNGREVTKYYKAMSDNCPAKDGFLLDRASNLCMQVVTSPSVVAWQDARTNCDVRNLSLVSLHTSSRLDFVISTLRQNAGFHGKEYFIGAQRKDWDSAWPGGHTDLRWLYNNTEVDTGNTQYWSPSWGPSNQNTGHNVLVLAPWNQQFLLSGSADTRIPTNLSYICEKWS
ncbi:hypothetical protein ACOMHN_041302 [Nucella lapillus]